MRRLLTGVDETGRSCAVDDTDLVAASSAAYPAFAMALVYATHEAPPPARPAARGDFLDLGVAPGFVNWILLEYQPGAEFAMHHTDTVDFDLVLQGSVELTLDDGVHHLTVGDCVVMTGVDHAWRAGPDGCRLSVTAIGTPAPE